MEGEKVGLQMVNDRADLDNEGLTAPMVCPMTTKNDMSAHSPLHKTNIGRVASMKAGIASMAVETPTFTEYRTSPSLSAWSSAQRRRFMRPRRLSEDRAGVWYVLGAWARVRGNTTRVREGSMGTRLEKRLRKPGLEARMAGAELVMEP